MPVREILKLGNPLLFQRSVSVLKNEHHLLRTLYSDLNDTLLAFRSEKGYGRAIAACQIGVLKRVILLNTDGPLLLINPRLSDKSAAMIMIWDDCMSFPDLLVRVRRHRSVRLHYLDPEWNRRELVLRDDMAELIQHEYDHLEGVLAVQRAVDGRSFALASQRCLLAGPGAN